MCRSVCRYMRGCRVAIRFVAVCRSILLFDFDALCFVRRLCALPCGDLLPVPGPARLPPPFPWLCTSDPVPQPCVDQFRNRVSINVASRVSINLDKLIGHHLASTSRCSVFHGDGIQMTDKMRVAVYQNRTQNISNCRQNATRKAI